MKTRTKSPEFKEYPNIDNIEQRKKFFADWAKAMKEQEETQIQRSVENEHL